MNSEQQQALLNLLQAEFNPDGDIHFLAISEQYIPAKNQERPVYQIRVALTFQEGESVNPYFDGNDLFVTINGTEIKFIFEQEWADGPPIMEGSPNGLALRWVSEVNTPFFVSPEALLASQSD
ncbi:hypothetical protein [Paenibacillus chitinolyticus]